MGRQETIWDVGSGVLAVGVTSYLSPSPPYILLALSALCGEAPWGSENLGNLVRGWHGWVEACASGGGYSGPPCTPSSFPLPPNFSLISFDSEIVAVSLVMSVLPLSTFLFSVFFFFEI